MSRLVSVFVVWATVLLLGTLAPVAAGGFPIRPHQHFGGLVNGSRANAAVRMACFGAIQPGRPDTRWLVRRST